jgi:hypothetical protein
MQIIHKSHDMYKYNYTTVYVYSRIYKLFGIKTTRFTINLLQCHTYDIAKFV